MMKVTLIVTFAILAVTNAKYNGNMQNNFVSSSERCFHREHLSQSYKSRFDSFIYPNEPAVHQYIRCIFRDLNLWNDRTGFAVDRIADSYRDKANTEVLIPILSECNVNTHDDPPAKWCYNGFKCILESRVGEWFKSDVNRQRTGHQ